MIGGKEDEEAEEEEEEEAEEEEEVLQIDRHLDHDSPFEVVSWPNFFSRRRFDG